MSDEIIASGILPARDLEQWAETFHSKGKNQNSALLHEAKVHFDSDGVHVTAVDAATVAQFDDTTLSPRAFEAYTAEGQAVIGIAFDNLIDKLGPASKDELVEFEVDMATRHLRLRYGSAEVTLAMIDPETVRSEPDSPDLDLPNTVTLTGAQLRRAVEVTKMVGDHIDIEADPDSREVTFRSQGDTDDADVTYDDADLDDPTVVAEETVSIYSLGYLDALTKPIPDDSAVTLTFGEDLPMYLDWEAFDGAFTVRQMIAPRIQSH